MRLGISGEVVSWFTVVVDHAVEVELAGREVDELFRGRWFDLLPIQVRSNPTLAPYLTSTAIDFLGEEAPEGAKVLAQGCRRR